MTYFEFCSSETESLSLEAFRYGLLLIRFEPKEGIGGLFKEIDTDSSGELDDSKFVKWYCQQSTSAESLYSSFETIARSVFDVGYKPGKTY